MDNIIRNGVNYFSSSGDQPVKLFLDGQQRYNSVTLGNGSYITDASLEFGGGRANHVLIGNYTSIAHRVVFLSGYNHDHKRAYTYPFDDFIINEGKGNTYTEANRYQIIIGNDVWIGRGVTVLGGGVISNGAVIGAGAVVTGTVPPYAVVVGNPARVVSYRFPLHVIEKMQQIKWWYWSRTQINENLPFMKNPEEFVERFYDSRPRFTLTPIVQQILQIKLSGKRIFFLPVDSEVANPVYEHVLDQYLKTYKKSDNIMLVLGYIQSDLPHKVQELLSVRANNESPESICVPYDLPSLLSILPQVDAVITTREHISSICVDYASDYNAKIYSGLDEKVFIDSKPLEKIPFFINPPLLTIGIPTYNRLKFLKKSLGAILEAVGNDPRVEILISDNDSTDKTAAFIATLQRKYSNLAYHKNTYNVGGNQNFLQIYKIARGKFVVACGDDDYFNKEFLYKVLEFLSDNDESSVVLLRNVDEDFKVIKGSGTVEYMRIVSFWTTFISGIVFRKDIYDSTPKDDRYKKTGLDQVYFQLLMLQRNPKFSVIMGRMLRGDSGQHKHPGGNFAKVFIANYLDIIERHAGLPKEDLSKEKLRLFNEMLVPWLNKIVTGQSKLNYDGLANMFDHYYKDEPYYPQAIDLLKRIKVLP